MKVLRTTVVRPLPGKEQKAAEILEDLGVFLAQQPGFVEAYELADDEDRDVLGHVSVWSSREDADRAASQVRTIALRARLHGLSAPEREERLLEVVSERHGGKEPAAIA